MTELQQNRYDQLLRRVGDLKGAGSKVNDVLQELFPTIDVENVPGELLFLMGTRIGWAGTAKSPTAGKKAGIQLFNPAESGMLITISSLHYGSSNVSTYTIGIGTTALATNTGLARFRDSRVGTGPSGVSQLRTSPDEVGISNVIVRLLGNALGLMTDGNSLCVLGPGTGISVTGSVDVNFNCNFFYRERVAEPSELSF